MTRLTSWLSADVMHALGWALIHSLWQGLGVAALAMLAMAFCRRPSVRYLIGVAALAVMLAAPAATALVLMRPPVSVLPILSKPAVPANRVAVTIPQLPAYPVVAGADRVIAAVAEAPSRMPNLLPWLVRAWLCGVAVFSLRFAGGFLLLEHRRRTQSGPPSARMLAICQELQRQLGLDRAIQYLECAWVEAPAVIGWLRPALLLPVFALTGLSEEQFRAVIAHELAHIRRHDWLVNLFQVLVETLLFYHPAMWWLNRRIRAERELCCDEIAVALTGSRLEYARALAQMAEWKNVSLLAMAANRGPLSERILHVLGRRPSNAGPRMLGLTGSVLFLAAGLGAANALFGIAYPIPAAKAEIKAVLVSSRSVVEHMARQVFPVSVPVAKVAAPQMPAPEKLATAADSQPGNLEVPSADLARLLPSQSIATPTMVASNAVSSFAKAPATHAAFNGQAKVTQCGNTSVFGRVISPNAVEMQGFYCLLSGSVGGNNAAVRFGSCPLASTYSYPGDLSGPYARDPSRTYRGDMVGRLNRLKEQDADCKFDTQMNVRLADPADVTKMQPGKMVRLAGDFKVTRQNNIDYLSVTDARVTWTDPFDRHAAAEQAASKVVASNAPPGAAPGDQPAGLISPAGPTQGETTMRKTLMAASSLVLLAGGSQAGAQSNGIPIGIHDPDALTCNAPELVTLAKAVNWRICVQNSLVATLGRDGGLNLGGTVVRSYSDLPISELPTGEGEPNAVTCESAKLLSGTRSRGPIVCAHNAFWAKLAAGGCVLTPDARTIIYSPTSKKWNTFACIHLRGRNGWLPRIFF